MIQPKYNNKNNRIFMGFDSIEINLFQIKVIQNKFIKLKIQRVLSKIFSTSTLYLPA